MSTENRMFNLLSNQSIRPSDDYNFLKVGLARQNLTPPPKIDSAAVTLAKLKNQVMGMIQNVDKEMIRQGVVPPTSYLEEAYFSNEQP